MLTEEKLKDLAALYTCSPSMSRARRNSLCARVQRQQQEQRWRDDERRDRRARAVGVVVVVAVIPERHPEPCPEPHAEFIGLSFRQPDRDRPAIRFDVRVPIVCPEKVCQKGAF